MKITLDRPALRALIDSDPEFSLSLKNNILAAVTEQFFDKNLRQIVAGVEPEMFKKAIAALQQDEDGMAFVRRALEQAIIKHEGPWGDRQTLTATMKGLITDEVNRAADIAVSRACTKVNEQILARVEARLAELNTDDRIEKRIARLTDEYVNIRVNMLFKERLAKLAV